MFGRKKTIEKKTAAKKQVSKNTKGEKSPLLQTPRLARRPVVSSATPIPRGAAPKTPLPANEEFRYISNEAHYDQVIERIKTVKKTLWIGTADIKDLYVKDGRGTKPLLEVLSDLAKRSVEIRLIHAKEPGPAFRQDFDKYPALIEGMERVLCPRVHFKIIIFDLKAAYVGSANLTGAGLGMKGENTRNFEAGVLSSNKEFIKNAATQFDEVWMGGVL
jgi:phosphatidylserine/phosphatidylglycerophosphate/cardiolipin synthase-like enzyme